MYPLYRSWLGAGPPHHPDPGALQTPPDTIIVVGDSPSSSSRQFAGHRAILTAHSGFFKGALSGRTSSPTSICVPSVFPEAFAPLLSFMYTGYLDISPDNIYGVLLATHYLHMPRALDLCWSYLRQNQLLPATVPSAPLVKPIPSRGKMPALTWHQPGSLNTILSTAEHSPFRSVFPPGSLPPGSLPPGSLPPGSLPKHVPVEPIDVVGPVPPFPLYAPPPRTPEPAPKTPDRDASESPDIPVVETPTPPPVLPPGSPGSPTDAPRTTAPRTTVPRTTAPRATDDQGAPVNDALHPESTGACVQNTETTSTSSAPRSPNLAFAPRQSSSKVVIDVACCDGPVRFHRVLNQSYGVAEDSPPVDCVEDVVMDDAVDENQVAQRRVRLPGAGQLRRARAERLAAAGEPPPGGGGGGGSTSPRNRPTDAQIDYTCLYCNHTFKSHYCYQKHASRHLNPVSPKGVIGHVKGAPAPTKASAAPPATTSRSATGREAVRPLDMNVQYYPCKTCGSKFPSYYFVHKHRKMCHLGEAPETVTSTAEGSAKSPEETAA